jgi:hypothetical protein
VLPAIEREPVAAHRREMAALIAPTDVIVIAGGHVAVLLNRIRLFALAPLFEGRPIIAWSAGAMALSERVVLFHDHPPHGRGIAEVLDAGLGLVRDLVVLPEPRQRLRLDDTHRVGMFAQRFAPTPCVTMDHGARIDVEHGAVVAATGVQRLATDGTIDKAWPA